MMRPLPANEKRMGSVATKVRKLLNVGSVCTWRGQKKRITLLITCDHERCWRSGPPNHCSKKSGCLWLSTSMTWRLSSRSLSRFEPFT